ncbi:hypothetical protein DFJ73DRAFT_542372 [Zopfochytrium polystomum]|nr:hypothetical protein DFJ73DRAFT_542372 [Zopfochytrium polystomum]
MIYAHERCKLVDREAIHELEAKVTIAASSSSGTDRAFLHVAIFLWRMGAHEQARQYLKKILDGCAGNTGRSSTANAGSPMTPSSTNNVGAGSYTIAMALSVMGWVDLTCGQETVMSRSLTWFDRVLESNPRDLDALMGRLQYLRTQRRQHTPALDITAQIIAYYPNFVPVYIERMHVLLEMGAWDQVMEASQRLSGLSPDSIDTTATLALSEICRDGRTKMAVSYLSNLYQVLLKSEPTNAQLFFEMAQPFARLAFRRETILEQTQRLVSKAIELDPTKSEYKAELGQIYLFLGNIERAQECFKSAATQNSHDISALQGLIKCHIYKGAFEEAEEQLEFFDAIQSSTMSPDTPYLLSLMARYRMKNFDTQMKYLKDAYGLLRKVILSTSLGLRFYTVANPDLLLEIARDFLEQGPAEPRREGEEPSPQLKTALDVLEDVIRIVPGSTEALFLLGKVKYLLGDMIAAQGHAASSLKQDASNAKAHILTAQIQLQNDFPKQAISSLEMALSNNFEVRLIPLFHLLKAKALKKLGRLEEALTGLNAAMQQPFFRDSGTSKQVPPIKRSDSALSMSERATYYLEVADIHSKLKQVHEASKVIEDASRIFEGTAEQYRIVLANADILIERGDVDRALALLSEIKSSQPLFIQSQAKMADIYLKHKNDKLAYARCYSELVERHRTVESSLLLGDAYLNIQEPEKAIKVYESALDAYPNNVVLASKIGKALVKTHDYGRAISYYESALAKDSAFATTLRYDLAELYFKLKNFKDAERIIVEALDHPRTEDTTVLTMDSKYNILLAKTAKGAGKSDKAVAALSRAREIYIGLISQQGASADSEELKIQASDVCYELAEVYCVSLKETTKALAYYNEAIQYHGLNAKAMLALCKLHISLNDLAAAQNHCANMLRMELLTDEATILMADIMFHKNQYTSAVFHFRQLLEKQPTHYGALRKLLEMMRRSGTLDEADKFFEMAEKSSVKVYLHPGYHFCRGLHYRYTNSPNDALKEFNLCRRDVEWGEQALYNMIEIFLNPDNDTLGGEALESVTDNAPEIADDRDESEFLAVITVDKLQKELPQSPKSLRTQVLECHSWMVTKQKAEIERALSKFTEILNAEKDYVPALLGISIAHMLLKQPPRARNHLKRIAKMDWTVEFADDFERGWLLLADVHIQGGKYDLATELLKRCISQNKSCAKAWEYLGFIMEKEAAYKDAAEHYNNAWKLERETNPAMGFKLAFNHLKAKKYVEAIEVCHKVLGMYPDYPKIRKEILDKSRGLLRT